MTEWKRFVTIGKTDPLKEEKIPPPEGVRQEVLMIEFTLEFQEGMPLYDQLYRFVVARIRTGELEQGERLPSKRALAGHLGVSLTTVERAYGLLTAEGYLESLPRSGFRVAPSLAAIPAPAARTAPPERRRERLNECFSTSAVDTSVFPFATWAKVSREAVYENPELLQRGEGQGDWSLRAALADFLHQYRGVECAPEQVVLAAGLEGVMWILLQLLPEAVFALEDPGYGSLRRLLDNLGRAWVPAVMDQKGPVVQALEQSGADVAYVTPSHQFPLGITIPAGRRGDLLRWAYARPGRYLVEDDYDSEFRYASRPIPAMQGMDEGGRVIYVGTFSRTIAPSIRVAYLILPPQLLEVYRAKFGHASATVSRFEQEALYRFLSSGAYSRHLRRVGNLYRKRRDALCSALAGWGEIRGADGGLHLLFTLPGREESDLVARAAKAGYRVRGLGEYGTGRSPLPGTLVLGFAGLPEEKAEKAVGELRKAFEEKG